MEFGWDGLIFEGNPLREIGLDKKNNHVIQ
jgi:hypothetical protein